MIAVSLLQGPHQSGQPFKFTIAESCDRIKEEFSFLQAQYHRYRYHWSLAKYSSSHKKLIGCFVDMHWAGLRYWSVICCFSYAVHFVLLDSKHMLMRMWRSIDLNICLWSKLSFKKRVSSKSCLSFTPQTLVSSL